MNYIYKTVLVMILMISVVNVGCSDDKPKAENLSENKNEHDRDTGEKGEGEESGTEFTLTEKYDKVRNGARLILTYDAESKSFIGTVENTTDKLLEKVRVEVHLSNGKELGPTTPTDLAAGKKMNIKLTTKSEGFTGWTAHPEVGGGEKGEHGREHEGEGGEHGEEGSKEHN